MYAKISSNELIMIAKEKDRSGQDVRNLQRYSMFNRKLSKATKYIILTTDPVAKRREVLLHLIRVVEVRQTLVSFSHLLQQDAYSVGTEMSSVAQLRCRPFSHGWDHIKLSG